MGVAHVQYLFMMSRLRERTYLQLEPSARLKPGLSPANAVICVLIVFSVLVAILETEEKLVAQAQPFFNYLEWVFTVVFLLEYGARLWVQGENPKYNDGLGGRLRYAVTPAALLDLLAIAPILVTFAGSEAFLLRLFRLLRVLRLARLGRFSEAMLSRRSHPVSRPRTLSQRRRRACAVDTLRHGSLSR